MLVLALARTLLDSLLRFYDQAGDEVRAKQTYTLSRRSTGSATTSLSTRSSLSFLTRGARKSLNSNGALKKEVKSI